MNGFIDKVWWVVALLTLGALAYAAYLPVYFDEAYYWLWGQYLDWGYFDHPPMVAYIVWFTTLISDHPLWIRLGAMVCNLGSLFFYYAFACDVYGKRHAKLALLLLALLPLAYLGNLILTPDAPLILFWSMGLFFGWRAITRSGGYWYATALAIGFMVASKLTAALFIVPFCVYIVWRHLELLRQKRVYGAGLLSLVPAIGMVYWNAIHDWPNIDYQIHRSGRAGSFPYPLVVAEYLASYLLVLAPVSLWVYIVGCRKRFVGRLDVSEAERFMFVMTAFQFVFFFYQSMLGRLEANWIAPIVMTTLPMVAYDLTTSSRPWLLRTTVVVAVLLGLLIRYPFMHRWEVTPLRHTFALQEAIALFAQDIQPGETLCSDYHTTAATMRYYLGDTHPIVVRFATRPSQFDMWPDSKPSRCRALVQRSKLRSYHYRDCTKISEQASLSVAVNSRHKEEFQTFVCDLR